MGYNAASKRYFKRHKTLKTARREIKQDKKKAQQITNCLKTETNPEVRQLLYKSYLKTDHWKRISSLRRKIDGDKCTICGSKRALNVHHYSYSRVAQSGELDDIATVCKKCHEKLHKITSPTVGV
jgi:hypothetical protein